MPFAVLPGVKIRYEDTGGTGVPVVLMHAASGNADCWGSQLPALTAAGYRCVTYDRRGWGNSVQDENTEAGYASDDLLNLANHLGIDRFHVAGTAAGAGPSLEFALTYPDRLRSLVLADCGAGASAEPEYERMRENYRPPEIDALPVHLRELSSGYRATDPEGTRRWIEIDHNSRHDERGGAPRQGSRYKLTYDVLKGIRVPTLMICGQADLVTPPALMRLSAPHIPGCRLELVQEAGHAAFWEQPHIWNKLVLEFIGKH